MTKPYLVAAMAAALLLGAPASAQSAADLLQKGIHAQETVGDVDSAIQIFRQVAALPGANKVLAAQAQYQLVVCMLQKGDRGAARKELELLARNFPDQPDLLTKARKLVPGGDTLVPAPWGEREGSQLNIKRDGVSTGEYFYYSVDPPLSYPGPANPQAVFLRWELQTANTQRSVQVEVDRDSLRPLGKPELHSNDYLGDPAAAPLAGPATDIEQSIFHYAAHATGARIQDHTEYPAADAGVQGKGSGGDVGDRDRSCADGSRQVQLLQGSHARDRSDFLVRRGRCAAAGEDTGRVAPHRIQNVVARQGAPRVRREVRQQAKFLGGQFDFPAAAKQLVRRQVQREFAEPCDALRPRFPAPQKGVHGCGLPVRDRLAPQ
jgi:hypothetical protein